MDEQLFKSVAEQLRKPQGEYAIRTGKKMNESNLLINLFTIEALKLTANDTILEIGMGNGFFVKDILSVDNSIHYTGCDFSEAMVEEASKLNEDFIKAGRATFCLANANHLPFANERFNKVFSVNTIYFWNDPSLILSEFWRVLKPKGQIIISLRPKSVMEHYPFAKYGFNMFTEDDLIDLLSKNNFRVMSTIEKDEPEQEVSGEKIPVKTLIICAEKL